MKTYLVTLIHGGGREVLHIIAGSTMRATQIALEYLPAPHGQFAVICKPKTKGAQ